MKYQDYIVFYRGICNRLLRRYPGVSTDLVHDMVSEAVLFSLSQQRCVEPILSLDDSTADSIYEKAKEKLRYELKKNKKMSSIEENESQTIYYIKSDEEKIHNELLIEAIIEKVPQVYRNLLSLMLRGLKYKDISETLGISLSATQKRAERLQKWLSNHQKDFE